MSIFLLIIAVFVCAGLVLVTAMHPTRPQYSLAELKRRSKHSEKYVLELDRYELHAALVTGLRVIRGILLVTEVALLIGALGWVGGILVALVIAIVYPAIARLRPIARGSQSLYTRNEPFLLDSTAKFQRMFDTLREPAELIHEHPLRFHSREDLAEAIERSKDVVGEREQQLLSSALAFPDKTVASVMTPRKAINFIKQAEFLGPLVLDELHALGHSRLPVIAEDLDHVTGVLHLRDLLSLDIKRSVTAEKAMEKKVHYIGEDDTLEHALAAFIRTRHHLFIVTDKNKETVGLVTLDDVIEALIGRRI